MTGALAVIAVSLVAFTFFVPAIRTSSSDGVQPYVTEFGINSITVVNATTNAILVDIAVGSYPYAIAVNPSTNTVYVANRVVK